MLYRHRRQRRRMRKGMLIFLSTVVTFGFLVYGFEKQVAVFSKSYIPSFAHRAASEAINDAVTAKINELDFNYEDIVKITYMKNGEVSAIETDSQKINLLKAQTTRAAQDELTAIKHSQIDIPLGAFTGFTLLSNSGPGIPLTYCMTGSFNSHLESIFENAGTNRTIHHIRLVVEAEIVTASVDYEDTMNLETDFEIAQTVISGSLPTIYGGLRTVY